MAALAALRDGKASCRYHMTKIEMQSRGLVRVRGGVRGSTRCLVRTCFFGEFCSAVKRGAKGTGRVSHRVEKNIRVRVTKAMKYPHAKLLIFCVLPRVIFVIN